MVDHGHDLRSGHHEAMIITIGEATDRSASIHKHSHMSSETPIYIAIAQIPL